RALEHRGGCGGGGRLGRRGRGGQEGEHGGEQQGEGATRHGQLLSGAAAVKRSASVAPVSSVSTRRIARSMRAGGSAPALPRNLASSSSRVSGASGPPRGRSWCSRSTRPSVSTIATSPKHWRGE